MTIIPCDRRLLCRVGFATGLALLLSGRGAKAAAPPPGLQAWGYGAITQGGTGGDVYNVTNLNDSGPGSLREGVVNRNGPRIIKIMVGGTVLLQDEIDIRLPYLTIDGSTAPGLGFTLQQASVLTPALKIIATHDIIIHAIRSAGLWVPTGPGAGQNDTAPLTVDGDGAPQGPTWDPNPQACGPTGAHLRNSCRIIIDRVTLSGSADDGPDLWCGIKDLTISRSLLIDNYHPRGNGCKGVYPEASPHARARITEYANVYAYNGERTPKLLEGVFDYDLVNNIIFAWQDYGTDTGNGVGGYGALWDDDGASDRHNVVANVFMPDTGGAQKAFCDVGASRCREEWDCVWGDMPWNDSENLLWADGLYYANNVFGPKHNPNECKPTATGQQPFPRPYTLPIASTSSSGPMEGVLDAAGVPTRTPREIAVVAAVRAALQARLGGPSPTPPPPPSPSPSPSASPTPTPKPPPTPRPTPRASQRPPDHRNNHDKKKESIIDTLKRRVEQLYCQVVGC